MSLIDDVYILIRGRPLINISQVPSGGGAGGAVAVAGGGGGAAEPEEKKEEKEEEKVCCSTRALDFVACSRCAIRRSRTMTWALGCSINPPGSRSVDYDENGLMMATSSPSPSAFRFDAVLCELRPRCRGPGWAGRSPERVWVL